MRNRHCKVPVREVRRWGLRELVEEIAYSSQAIDAFLVGTFDWLDVEQQRAACGQPFGS